MPATQLSADKDAGTITASTQSFELKSGVTADGSERDFIEGFLATTHTDKVNDRFTEEALKQMAEDINKDNTKEVEAVFNDVDTDALREAQTGNLDHNNNPAAPFGDTRTVPAFKVQKAEVQSMDDGETGLWIKAMLNTGGMLADTVSAVKNSIKDGFLDSFSIEFVPEKVRQVREGGRVVRIIEAAKAKGAALTGRPANDDASMTGADLKSMATEYKVEDELKQSYTVQRPSYDATSTASWSKPAMEDFPEGYEVMSIFLVRNDESDDFSDQSLPVVDWRNGEPTLVLEALRSAHQLASRVDGLSDDEVEDVRMLVEELAMSEFDEELGEGKNDTMSEDDVEETDPESEPEVEEETKTEGEEEEEVSEKEENEQSEDETKSLSDDVQELKSTVQEVKDRNDELEERNEELKSELDDLKTLQDIKSEVDEVKNLLEDVELENGPRAETEQKRFEEEQETKAAWKRNIDAMDNPDEYLSTEGKSKSRYEAFAQNHEVDIQEVKNYVRN